MHLTAVPSLCDYEDDWYALWEGKHSKPVGRVGASRDTFGPSLAPRQVKGSYVHVHTGLVWRGMERGHCVLLRPSSPRSPFATHCLYSWSGTTRSTQRSSSLFPWSHFSEWHHHPRGPQSRTLLLSTSFSTSAQSPSPGKLVFNINKIFPAPSIPTAPTLVHTTITSCLHDCDGTSPVSLTLTCLLHAAARMISVKPDSTLVPVLWTLWNGLSSST